MPDATIESYGPKIDVNLCCLPSFAQPHWCTFRRELKFDRNRVLRSKIAIGQKHLEHLAGTLSSSGQGRKYINGKALT